MIHTKILLWMGSISAIIGLILLFSSVSFGNSMAVNWLTEQGGSSPEEYNIVMKSYINSFIVCGGILFAFGLFMNGLAYFTFLINNGDKKQQL